MPYTHEELEAIAALIEFYKISNKSYICKCGIQLKNKRSIPIHIKTKGHITWITKHSPIYNKNCNRVIDIMSFYE
jgi:hypothetical protein